MHTPSTPRSASWFGSQHGDSPCNGHPVPEGSSTQSGTWFGSGTSSLVFYSPVKSVGSSRSANWFSFNSPNFSALRRSSTVSANSGDWFGAATPTPGGCFSEISTGSAKSGDWFVFSNFVSKSSPRRVPRCHRRHSVDQADHSQDEQMNLRPRATSGALSPVNRRLVF